MNISTLILTFALATHCLPAGAAPQPIRVSAPAGAVVALPAGQWRSAERSLEVSPLDGSIRLPLINAAHSYRFQSDDQLLEIEQTTCARKVGGIFEDCLDGLWEAISSKADSPLWAIAQQDNNWVLDVTFTSDTPFSIESGANSDRDTPNEWIDLRAFAQGTLSFDLKIVSFGNNLNGFEVGIGGDLQSLATIAIHPADEGRWQSYSIALGEFTDQGLALAQVQQGFVLKTAPGEFKDVRLQLDNIRFNAPIPDPMDWALVQ